MRPRRLVPRIVLFVAAALPALARELRPSAGNNLFAFVLP